jgi:hypothetical protein
MEAEFIISLIKKVCMSPFLQETLIVCQLKEAMGVEPT